jgi:hypothetical protein
MQCSSFASYIKLAKLSLDALQNDAEALMDRNEPITDPRTA